MSTGLPDHLRERLLAVARSQRLQALARASRDFAGRVAAVAGPPARAIARRVRALPAHPRVRTVLGHPRVRAVTTRVGTGWQAAVTVAAPRRRALTVAVTGLAALVLVAVGVPGAAGIGAIGIPPTPTRAAGVATEPGPPASYRVDGQPPPN